MNLEYDEQASRYIKWVNDNYDVQKAKLMSFCHNKKFRWDEDIFSETYLKIYDKIKKCGIDDDTETGFDNYTFRSFRTNLQREALYARNQKRDKNIIDLSGKYEEYSNEKLTQEEKLKSDLWKDFSTLYLMQKVEENFDSEHFYLFRLKTFDKHLTYQKLQEKTGIKGVRQKVVDVRNWLKANVTKGEIDKAFTAKYGNLL